MKSIDVFCHLMPKKYAELAMNESPNRSHMFVRALKTQAMSDMDYRGEVIKKFPGYKQIPNIVSPPLAMMKLRRLQKSIRNIMRDLLPEFRLTMFPHP